MTHPIVLTSSKPARAAGARRLGGPLVIGRGPRSQPGGEWEIRGDPGLMAGGGANPDPDDSSGRLSYVRVEYAGANVASGVPQTAVAFYTNGAGTQADHIMAKYGSDDGIEWYGGRNSLKYGISVGIGDEGFDCQYGWDGRAQFLICLQRKDMGTMAFRTATRTTSRRSRTPWISKRDAHRRLIRRGPGATRGCSSSTPPACPSTTGSCRGGTSWGLEFGDAYGPSPFDRCAFYGNVANCRCDELPCPCGTLFEAPLQNVASTVPVIVDAGNLDDPDLRGIEAALPPAIDPTTIDRGSIPPPMSAPCRPRDGGRTGRGRPG